MARLLAAEATPQVHLVLAGGGHTHALVLRGWAMHPRRRPRAWITLVSRHSTTLYSGMVPGLVAGLYGPEECSIDLRRLADQAGVSFVEAEITGVDPAGGRLLLEGRPPLRFDWLSLDVGAVVGPAGGGAAGTAQEQGTATSPSDEAEHDTPSGGRLPVHGEPPLVRPLPVKPLEPFLAWCARRDGRPPAPVTVRGSGAAAVEVALALQARGHTLTLQTRPEGLALGSRRANRLVAGVLRRAGITMSGPAPDPVIDCTGSRGPAWLQASGLPVDARGRVRTDASLQVEGLPQVFASGDCGVVASQPRPPSGVWAVRAAPVLGANLERAVRGQPLRRWHPQARALQLLGDGGVRGRPHALALWGPLVLGPSRWLWLWKDRIDRRFMRGFRQLVSMPTTAAMACRGCAAKVAAAPLEAALQRLAGSGSHPDGLAPLPEDAALLGQGPGGTMLLQSVDGFPALVSDPWLNGRLTTLHACSDLWASGARISSVQAVVTLPALGTALQTDLLHQTLAGVCSVLDPLGAPLVGGHTLEARDTMAPGVGRPCPGLAITLTVNGSAPAEQIWSKGPLRPGDALVLTRAIGTGVLFAASMAGAARPAWIDGALAVMQQSQADLVPLLAAYGCHACTDITGFGLLGHLGEMLRASASADPAGAGLVVTLEPEAIPALPGARDLIEAGHASTLAPSNAGALSLLAGPVRLMPGHADDGAGMPGLLIDPQTCGPLLAAIPGAHATAVVAALRAAGFPDAAVIAQVIAGP